MRRLGPLALLLSIALLSSLLVAPAFAQDDSPPQATAAPLTLFTRYPALEAAIGETVSIPLTLQTGTVLQIVRLSVQDLPEGWTASFKGGGRAVEAAYVLPDNDASVDLRVEVPKDAVADTYRFTVVADGEDGDARLPIELTIEEKLPPSLAFTVDLPTIRGAPTATFRYDVTLKNEGDQDLSVNLLADAPAGFQVAFKLSGQDVTSLPIAANETKRLSVEVKAFNEIAAGPYSIDILAQGGEAEASTTLTADVTGQPDLSVTTSDGRLSGQAHAGQVTPLKVVIQNNGSAAARDIQLSASQPNNWSVEFTPAIIAQLQAGEQVEVTANLKPAEQSVAGDYMVTVRARPSEGASKSADFRITVRTSTMWGVVGVALIAVAVAVVGLAVARFGRR